MRLQIAANQGFRAKAVVEMVETLCLKEGVSEPLRWACQHPGACLGLGTRERR